MKGATEFESLDEARRYLARLFAFIDEFSRLKWEPKDDPGSVNACSSKYKILSGGMRSYQQEIDADPKFLGLLRRAAKNYRKYTGLNLSVTRTGTVILFS